MKKQTKTTAAGPKVAKTAKASTTKKTPARKATKATAKKAATESVTGTLTLPAPGQKLVRAYHGKDHTVEVTKDGFRYEGETFTSLTALAKKITGYRAISGPAFFGLWKRAEAK